MLLIFANSVCLSGFYTKDRLNNEKYNQNQCDEPMLATMMVLILFFITMHLHAKYYPHEISIFSHRLTPSSKISVIQDFIQILVPMYDVTEIKSP